MSDARAPITTPPIMTPAITKPAITKLAGVRVPFRILLFRMVARGLPARWMTAILLTVLPVGVIAFSSMAFDSRSAVAQQGTMQQETPADQIRHLLDYIGSSPCTFIRNGTEYDGKSALKHVQDKYDYYKDNIHTAEDFIRLAASKSMMSGRPYLVRCPGVLAVPAADWLQTELRAYRQGKLPSGGQ